MQFSTFYTRSRQNLHRRVGASLLIGASLASAGCGKGQQAVPGLEDFHVGVVKSRLYVSFVSVPLNWDVGVTLPIPGLKDASFSVAPNLGAPGTVFQFAISLDSLVHDGRAFPLSGLPDGRPLPDVRGGQLPRWDIPVRSNLTLSLYLSDDAFSLFVPLNFISSSGVMLPLMIAVTIEDERGNRLGKVYAIPMDVSGSGSGLLVLLPYLGSQPSSGGLVQSSVP